MRLHVVSLPHTQTTKAYSTCAYTEKVRKFCNMMIAEGHEVFLYAGDQNEADCTELITCISRVEQREYGFAGPQDYLKIDFNSESPWHSFNYRVAKEMKQRIEPEDFICVITGTPAEPIRKAFPKHVVVEFGVGYSGIMQGTFHVFESEAWRNYVYGYHRMDGQFFDEVIPNYFDINDFPLAEKRGDYFLFIGRLNANKGLPIAQDVCQRLGQRLVVAGPGSFSGYGEYVGVVDPKQRGKLMSEARAVFVPTIYVPPFEGVHIEAMLCGTPVITTDFGVFKETVFNGTNGTRCRNMAEFMEAVGYWSTPKLDTYITWREAIQHNAQNRYSLEAVGKLYTRYFKRLSTLYGDGFYANV